MEPIDTHELRGRIETGITLLGERDSFDVLQRVGKSLPYWLIEHYKMEHTNPSPSSIMECRYKQWCWAKDLPTTDDAPLNWRRRRSFGIMAEPYWIAILELGGVQLLLAQSRYPCGPHMNAHPDAIGSSFVVEIKDMTGWGYKNLVTNPGGVQQWEPGHYAQLQLYMHAVDHPWGLYLAATPDPSLLQSKLRQQKRFGPSYELPPFYFEWVKKDPDYVDYLLQRAEMLVEDQKSDAPPPREFSGIAVDSKGKRTWPCGYCPHQPRCVETHGWGPYGY